ncbi:helix-turn-helix domain-containing protein [Neisseria sp. ZJ106]|uniref:Helix-turn-helix domain-containing protein n=1 Tax=Neisseria lisongii TaxID=2912188 RepID=A0ABY7RJG0_9NEIS|nr:helix-turn-helix domain-containing protein [Neisseria lisongii]MCF7520449.1 helix-turn-helix domain-containing protein [Neisseria lisongii]WCL71608.1 helix-turn-helix domain-containing protein [Neisseria lisongii]
MQNKTARNTQSISDGHTPAGRHHTQFAPDSQCSEILAVLKSGQSLTSYQGAQMGIIGFHARIKELRDAGYHIACTMQPHINKHGKTVKRGSFSLVSEKGAAA